MSLDYFKRFIPNEANEVKEDPFVWIYTRVSSKEQFEKNSSVDNQLAANRAFASMNNYRVTEEFGGTYESAKSDFTRKEFNRLISKVESSRKKPYAILVYKMSRFSRSGGNAIGLVNRLVDEIGVHLIEVSSGLTTTSERGKAAIYESLFHAYKENLERKEIIIPSMKRFLEKGNWLATGPIGYDHYGPRVRTEKFFARRQRIVINKEGLLIKEAWRWKLSGLYSDAQIIRKLAARGLVIRSQKLSKIWRNPFYCGVIINRLLTEPQKGNWEPLVSEKDFIKVQQILDGSHSGYHQNKEEENRPLLRSLRCNNCGGFMVGYVVRKKNLHYYRCLKCNGVNLNAKTTSKAKKTGGDELFLDLLHRYSLPGSIAPLIKKQLVKLLEYYQSDVSGNENSLETRLKNFEQKKKELTIRLGLGEIDKEAYAVTLEHLSGEMQEIHKEINTLPGKISNLENLLEVSLKKLEKLSVIWGSGGLEDKRMVQKIVFPNGFFYDAQKHEYLTRGINQFVLVTADISNRDRGNEKGDFQNSSESPLLVPRTGIEPVIHP
ncbi:recombinase family protein [Niabella hirudinis]|uniref:recombinase family protein n=1 Tax=Niabella hirudinis TaxID=1285929 RepID=UPI003EBE228B